MDERNISYSWLVKHTNHLLLKNSRSKVNLSCDLSYLHLIYKKMNHKLKREHHPATLFPDSSFILNLKICSSTQVNPFYLLAAIIF